MGMDVSVWFPVNVGLRQGCVMSPWLELLIVNGGWFEINDTVLVADSGEKLCRLVSQFGRVQERRKLRVNIGKSKVMRCSRYRN